MTSYLKIEQLHKRFGSFTALNNISLDVKDGEFICFLGPSGCGKTTLLRAIAGLEIQEQGCIVQSGQDVSALPPQQRDFGIVFQSYALFPNLTVADNIAYGLVNQKINRQQRDQRVRELLEQIDLPGIQDKFPGQLSGGQQQRVALARALATEPGLLLLDEPLSALDARVRLHLRQEIRDLQQKLGITTIMVTHDQDEALTMADRIVVMDHGCIAQVGTPQEIYDRPATAFVARFIGSMNLIAAQVMEDGGVMLGSVEANLPIAAQPSTGLLGFRPESVDISNTPRAADAGKLQLQGKVRHLSFMGAYVRVGLEIAEDLAIEIDLSVSETEQKQVTAGASLWVDVAAEALHYYPDNAGSEVRSGSESPAVAGQNSMAQVVAEAS